MPRQTIVPVVWTSEGAGRYGGSTANFWNRTLQYDAAEVAEFSSPAFQRAPKSPQDAQLAAAGWPGNVFKRTLQRKLPAPPKQAPASAAWFEWLSERCTLVYPDFRYDGKVFHIDLRKGQVHFYVLISYRTTPRVGIWTHELLRLRIRGTPLRPFDGTHGAEWPGPDDMQAPGQPSDVLFAVHPDGREEHARDLWANPLSEIVIAVGPAPHVYLQPTHLEAERVWVEDDTGVVLSKDSRRPAQWQGYRGDEIGRFTRVWVNRDKVTPVLRSAVGYAPGATWDRRNKLVLYTYWKRFRKLTNWFKGEKLFDYDFSMPDDVLKFHSFLLIEPLSDPWLAKPTAAQFRERCVHAERLAYDHFRLPHTRGAAPVPRLAANEDEQEAAEDSEDEAEDEAEADESSRTSLAGFPPRCTLVWGRLDGVVGKLPDAALRITHVGAGGDASEFAVKDVSKIAFPEPSDGFHAVAQSSLLNTPQLSSMYSTTGSRCHLVLCFEPLLTYGTLELNTSDVFFAQAAHAADDDAGRSPYEVRAGGRIFLKPQFHAFVFEAFYDNFVRGSLDKVADQLGKLVLVEFPIYHPHMLIGRGDDELLKRPQTFLDSVYRAADGTLTLVDMKTLMQARPPHARLLDPKNLRQVVTNALFFQLMTRLRLKRVALASVTRQGTVTLVQVDLLQCTAVTTAAALTPLKGGAAVRTLMNTGTRFAVDARLKIPALDDLGVDTSAEGVAGEPMPDWLTLPKAPAPAPPPPPPPPPAQRPRRASPPPRRTASPSPPPPIGAPLDNLYVNPELAAQAVVAPAMGGGSIVGAVGASTAVTRADINDRIGVACELLFDTLSAPEKAKLRGRADALFKHLAHGALFNPERVADAVVEAVDTPALNEPRHYAPAFSEEELRPEVLQVLIRTTQRALNAAVVHQFARTRSERANAEVADGVTTREFLESVLHHSRRDLWTADAVGWAEGRVDGVIALVHGELEQFLRSR
jgi:hypothetical protein